MIIDVNVGGLVEINKALHSFELKVANKIIRQGVYAGASLLRAAIRNVTPVRKTGGRMKIGPVVGGERFPGFLKKNIGFWKKKRTPRNLYVFRIGPKRDAFYGNMVEAGHAAGKRKKYGLGITAATGLKMVPAHPFMGPTFYSNTDVILARVKGRIWRGIKEEGEKLGFKTEGIPG